MRSNSYNKYYGITTFGESHGKAIGVVIEDVKPGILFPFKKIQKLLNERKPGKGKFSTTRKEQDELQVLSGIFNDRTTGLPICMLIYNKNFKSEDYDHLKNIFRPGHADISYYKKFKIYDHRGGGRASGRETISRVAASGLITDLLGDISINIYPVKIGKFTISEEDLTFCNHLNWHDRSNYDQLEKYLKKIKSEGNSIGGILQVKINNIPAGLGDPVFEKLDANLAKAIVSIGSVKGIEFGDGFSLAALKGDLANDEMDKNGFITNHSGGILGGISTGSELTFRFVVKPTSSINISQKTITKDNKQIKFKSSGRHDTCIIPRIIPVAKAMIKLVLADAKAYQKLIDNKSHTLSDYREMIDKIDEELLIAISRRQKISELIGRYKKKHDLSTEDSKRENDLLQNIKTKANMWNLDSQLIKKIWKILLENSKKIQ